MDFFKIKEVNKLEEALTEIVASEYNNACAYVNVDKVELSYIACEEDEEPMTTITIRYGVTGEKNGWQKTIELYYKKDSIDFIAGQFFQAMVDQEE